MSNPQGYPYMDPNTPNYQNPQQFNNPRQQQQQQQMYNYVNKTPATITQQWEGRQTPVSQNQQQSSTQMNQPYIQQDQDPEKDKIVQNILNLRDLKTREEALQELSKKRESFPNLAPLLWHSVGTIAILIQEIVSIYNQLSPPNLASIQSTRVCNVLGLLQCLALHQETKVHFLKAHIPLFLYPFLNTSNKNKPFENLRVTSLGVIGALVKGEDSDAITFLMQTEIIPLCLRIMKRGQELSRTVATFIVQKILVDENGLKYICHTAERFFAVSTVLTSMIDELSQPKQETDQRLLRHIIKCYLRLSENSRANEALKKCLPEALKTQQVTFIQDENVKRWHLQLLQNLDFIQRDPPSQYLSQEGMIDPSMLPNDQVYLDTKSSDQYNNGYYKR